MPKRKTVARYIKDLYDEEKEKVKASLDDVEFCAMTTDGGSSSNATSFQVFCFESKIIIVHIIFSSSPLSPSSSLNSSSCLQDTNIQAKKAPIPNTVETGEEIPLRAGHKHSSRESFQLDGLPPQ